MKPRNRATLSFTIMLLVSFYFASCQIDSTQEGSIAVIWVYKDGKFGYIDDIGREVIPCQYDYKSGFSEGWTALKKGNNWSYYDDRGEKVLDLGNRFTYCGQFHDGVAFVSTLPTNGISPLYAKFYENISKEIQFINRKGEVIFKVDNEWNVSHIDLMRGFSEGLLGMHKEIEPYNQEFKCFVNLNEVFDANGDYCTYREMLLSENLPEELLKGKSMASIGINLSTICLNLRKLPKLKSPKISCFGKYGLNGLAKLFEIESEGKWIKVEIDYCKKENIDNSDMDEGGCGGCCCKIKEDEYTGWMKAISENGFPNIWYSVTSY